MKTIMNNHTHANATPRSILPRSTTLSGYVFAVLCSTLLIVFVASVQAQEPSTSYRGTMRDPFVKYKPVARRAPGARKAADKPAPPPVTVVAAPGLQQRIDGYKSLKVAAMNAQQPAPKPVTALLLNEVAVTGIFRTPRGYAAMVEATPINLSYVIYPGEMFYDGQLVAVEEDRLVFRRETKYSNGKSELGVEMKPLRPASAVTNAMVSSRTTQDAAPDTVPAASVATTGAGASGNPR